MTDPKAKDVNWDEYDDIDSDDDHNSSSSSSSDSGDEGKEEEKHHRNHHGHSGHNRQTKNQYEDYRAPRKNFVGDPNSNYNLYYRNDPDFFVKVIQKEDPPHEL
jgi:hypothetical protein